MPSFDVVNYSLRPNKSVERKIVFSGLQAISKVIDLTSYKYLGLGSLWFVDYVMAHRLLGISSMISIERDSIGVRRAEFNRPLGCITVVPGDSTVIIPTLNLADRPSITWFDYDSSIDGPVLEDLALLVPKCASNSILIVTINAKRDELPLKDESGADVDSEASLRRIAGDLVPTPLPAKRMQLRQYPKLLCEILANQLHSRTVNSGRPETFVKLFDLAYTDSTPMVTVGGILAAHDRLGSLNQLVASNTWEGMADDMISIPPLTTKEKMTLDRMMPAPEAPTVDRVVKAGFALKAEQIKTYHRYYRHYPMFAEYLW